MRLHRRGYSADAMSLLVRFTKRADGGVVFRCERADGTVTWQRQDGRQAQFFPFHDLRHFAVETTLGFRQGFFGLLAEGWEIADTGGKGSRGRLPDEAVVVEHVVGLFDHERVGGAAPLSAAEFNSQLQRLVAAGRIPTAPAFSDAQLAAVRSRIDALHNDWAMLAPGETLTLTFEPAAPAP
jgi:hypothetical protein